MQGSRPERMLREFAEFLEAVAVETVVILVFEDLHWSAVSTLELLSHLAQRRVPVRLQVIGTYRPAEVAMSGHPLRRLVQELHGHRQCEELVLKLLTEGEVEKYLNRRLARSPAVAELSQAVYTRTDGNALFTVNFIDYLIKQGLIVIMRADCNGTREIHKLHQRE